MAGSSLSEGANKAFPPCRSEAEHQAAEADLADLVRQLMAGAPGIDKSAAEHLRRCDRCSAVFLALTGMLTIEMVDRLEQALVDPGAVDGAPLDQWAHLWRLNMACSERQSNATATAASLAVLGMLHRCSGQRSASVRGGADSAYEDAAFLHRRALRLSRDVADAWPAVHSHADLALLALDRGQSDEALFHLEKAAHALDKLPEGPHKAAMSHRLQGVGGRISQATAQAAAVVAGMPQSPMVARAPASAAAHRLHLFLNALRRPAPLYAAGPGEAFFVVNTNSVVKGNIVAGPKLDRDGEVSVSVTLHPRDLDALPQPFTIELVFLPDLTIVGSAHVGEGERVSLQSVDGLRIAGSRPDLEVAEARLLPRAAVALRIWWSEDDAALDGRGGGGAGPDTPQGGGGA